MANEFNTDLEILEGFLCPICREDFKTPERLTAHVGSYHSEEQDLLKSLKDIFSKAKKKIKSNFDETVDLAKSLDNTTFKTTSNFHPEFNAILNIPQKIGTDCDHISYFKAVRTPLIERSANETNKLIIRLHKLIKDRPSDPVQRKQHEQKMVPWLDGTLVKLCPGCAKSFHIARRQHHCRLCGSIMCMECSRFLDHDIAINLVGLSTPGNQQKEHEKTKDNDKENFFRICEHCLRLLESRVEMQDSRTYRPQITLHYEKIKELRLEISPDIPTYSKMINSLYEGNSIFTITDASALRGKIGRVAEHIDNISKAILVLQCPVGSREEALKKAVRLACVQYIKEELLSLPPLPVEDEITKLQEKRRRETEQRIERERRLALEAYEKYELVGSMSHVGSNNVTPAKSGLSATGSAIRQLDNWSGHQASVGIPTDPLVEQMNIIRGYIKQARSVLRFEDVATLEGNLRELQQEFYERHRNPM